MHTGQHYDTLLSSGFFDDLDIPAPDFNLEVGSATHAVQTARILERFEPVLTSCNPDWLVGITAEDRALVRGALARVRPERRPA